MAYQAYRSGAHSAIANMAIAPGQAPAGPDWSRQWYDSHRAIHDNVADAVAVLRTRKIITRSFICVKWADG
jgi:hypothetical protein